MNELMYLIMALCMCNLIVFWLNTLSHMRQDQKKTKQIRSFEITYTTGEITYTTGVLKKVHSWINPVKLKMHADLS